MRLLAAVLLFSGCTGLVGAMPPTEPAPVSDSGTLDDDGGVGVRDGGEADAGSTDAGGDAGSGDAGKPDAGRPIADAGLCNPVSAASWENITPPEPDAHPAEPPATQQPLIDSRNSARVLVAQHSGGNGNFGAGDGLYASNDCGESWSRVSAGQGADEAKKGSWSSMVVDPLDPDVMYTVTVYGPGGLWKSTNGGVTWAQTMPDFSQFVPYNFFNTVSQDPGDRQHLISSAHSANCTGAFAPTCLAETTDGGAGWRMVAGPISTNGGDGASVSMLNGSTWYYSIPGGGLFRTVNAGADWVNIYTWPPVWSQLYQAPNGDYFMAGGNGVLHSKNGIDWSEVNFAQVMSIVASDTYLYAADLNSRTYYRARLDDLTQWSTFTNAGMPSDQHGAAFLAYDRDHHILYSSNWSGGLWRISAP